MTTVQTGFTPQAQALAKDILAYWDLEAAFKELVDFELNPGVHNQASWVGRENIEIESVDVDGRRWDVCDSTMCAAGTAVFLTSTPKEFKEFAADKFYDSDFWHQEARKLLGLSNSDSYYLFFDTDNDEARTLMGYIAENKFDEFSKHIANGHDDDYDEEYADF